MLTAVECGQELCHVPCTRRDVGLGAPRAPVCIMHEHEHVPLALGPGPRSGSGGALGWTLACAPRARRRRGKEQTRSRPDHTPGRLTSMLTSHILHLDSSAARPAAVPPTAWDHGKMA
eukprot:3948703-Prymnesium_polylepis.1